jgi:hypothetical protein
VALRYGIPGTSGPPLVAVLPIENPDAVALLATPPLENPGAAGERAQDETATCTREGHSWRVTLGARSALVRHSVGMLHLVVLLANPNVEIRAVDLVAGVAGLAEAGRDPVAQPLLDPAAVRDYRRRLTELTAEIDEAEATGPAKQTTPARQNPATPARLDRAARARQERDWLIAQLGAGTGFGGRPRRFSDGTENARLAVGKAIRRAIARVAEADRIIGDHLTRTVHTGVRCAYLVQCPPAGVTARSASAPGR